MPLKINIDAAVDPRNLNLSVAALTKFSKAVEKGNQHWSKYQAAMGPAVKAAGALTKAFEDHASGVERIALTHTRFTAASRSAGSIFTHLARDSKGSGGRIGSLDHLAGQYFLHRGRSGRSVGLRWRIIRPVRGFGGCGRAA